MFEQADIHQRICLGNARALDKIQNGSRRVATAAQGAQGGHARVIPALHMAFEHKLAQVTFAHYRMGDIQACKFALLGMVGQGAVVHDPLIQWAMVFELNGAHRVGNPLKRVLDRVGEVV